MRIVALTFIISLIITPFLCGQSDCEGCKDYPLLPRMPEYSIKANQEIEFDSESFYFDNKKHPIEGRKYVIDYIHNESTDRDFTFPSRLQLLRNYSSAIEDAGGRILFERSNAEHGYYTFQVEAGKEIWVKVTPRRSGKSYRIIVIEKERMKQDILISAELIKNKIEIFGRIALQGIYFDVGYATIRSESEAALIEIASFLNENPEVQCWVVGHTDSDGSFQLNSKLSQDRATAIKLELESTYGIDDNRLFAEGVGPLAPVASNLTEEGKQKNRRVELVLK